MRVEQLDITPEMALAMLRGNAGNRKADKTRIRQYAADMKAGRWKLTPQTIGIAHDGRVVDGQHRLYAIVESDTTQAFLVVFEADPDSFGVIDIGKIRTGNDIWRIAGKSAPNVAAIARLAYLYANHRDAIWDTNLKVPAAQVLDWAVASGNEDILRRAGNYEKRVRKEVKGLGAIPGAALAITEIASGATIEEVYEEVFEPLVKTLGFEEGQPVYAFHRVLSKRSNAGIDNPFCPGLLNTGRVQKARLAVVLQLVVDVFNGTERKVYRPTLDCALPDMATALSNKPTTKPVPLPPLAHAVPS
jgi:hypothetical protein